MKVTTTKLQGLLIIEPTKFGDERGFFSEVFKATSLAEYGFEDVFVQDNHAYSAEVGVLRGLHYQAPPHAQDKLVRVIKGAILDVVVDIRTGSPTYGEWVAVELSAQNWKQLLVPKGFAHGYLTLEPDTEVLYKVTDGYAPEVDCGLMWNDRILNIDWNLNDIVPILSAKDQTQPNFENFTSPFTF